VESGSEVWASDISPAPTHVGSEAKRESEPMVAPALLLALMLMLMLTLTLVLVLVLVLTLRLPSMHYL
jgi:hypothetical protein